MSIFTDIAPPAVLLVSATDYLVLIALCVTACILGGVAGRYAGSTLMPAPDGNPGARVTAVFGAMVARMLVTLILMGAIIFSAPRWAEGGADQPGDARFAAGVVAACCYALLCLAEPAWAIRAMAGQTQTGKNTPPPDSGA